MNEKKKAEVKAAAQKMWDKDEKLRAEFFDRFEAWFGYCLSRMDKNGNLRPA